MILITYYLHPYYLDSNYLLIYHLQTHYLDSII